MAQARINQGKNSVRNLQYGPRTRLVRAGAERYLTVLSAVSIQRSFCPPLKTYLYKLIQFELFDA